MDILSHDCKKIIESMTQQRESYILENLYMRCMVCGKLKKLKELKLVEMRDSLTTTCIEAKEIVATYKLRTYCTDCIDYIEKIER